MFQVRRYALHMHYLIYFIQQASQRDFIIIFNI